MPGERIWVAPRDAGAIAAWGLGFAVTPKTDGTEGIALSPEVPFASALAETARSALWALSNSGSDPVYVTRLLNAARPIGVALRSRLDGAHRARAEARTVASENSAVPQAKDVVDMIRHTLRDLEVIGDVVALPAGHWLPAPGRVVRLHAGPDDRGATHVLLGGPPTHLLSDAVRAAIAPGGLARVLRWRYGTPDGALDRYPVQSDATWRLRPTEPIDNWARGVLDGARLDGFEDATVAFEVYAPLIATETRRRAGQHGYAPTQYFRWVSAAEVPNGRYVVRHDVAFGRRYAMSEVRAGRVCALGEPALGRGDLRRLLYGVDAIEGLPTSASVRAGKHGDPYQVSVSGFLPGSELRLCTAAGRLILPSGDRYLPQTWEVGIHAVPEVLMALKNDLRMDLRDA